MNLPVTILQTCDRLSPPASDRLKKSLEFAASLMSRGLLSPANLEEPTNILVTGYLEEGGVFVEEPELHLELLEALNCCVSIYQERITNEIDFDDAIHEMASCTQGVFAPDSVTQEVEISTSKGVEKFSYHISARWQQKDYHLNIVPRSSTACWDSLINFINGMLRAKNVEERFILTDFCDEHAYILFGTKSLFQELRDVAGIRFR